MTRYVTLYQFTDQGIRNVKDSPARLKAAIQQAEAIGMKMIGAYYTEGAFDLITISEASDEKAATAFALAVAAQGNVRSSTMRAYDADEFQATLELMP